MPLPDHRGSTHTAAASNGHHQPLSSVHETAPLLTLTSSNHKRSDTPRDDRNNSHVSSPRSGSSSPIDRSPVADSSGNRIPRRRLLFFALLCLAVLPGIFLFNYVQDVNFSLDFSLPDILSVSSSTTPTTDLITNRFYKCYNKTPHGNETVHQAARETQLRKWLRLSADTFEAANMPFHLNRGILLAWYRDCSPDFGGADIDYEIFDQDWDRPHLSNVWNDTMPNGSWITHYPPNMANDVLPGWPPVVVQDAYRLWSTVHLIDMWIMYKMENFWWISNLQASYYYWFYPFKLAHARFLDVDFLVPEPPICYLIQLYGTTWNEHMIDHNKNTTGATWGEADYYVASAPNFTSTSNVPPRFYEDPQNLRECYKDPRPFLEKYGIDEQWIPDDELPAEYVPPPVETESSETS